MGSDFGASITHELSRIIFFAIEAEQFSEGQSIYVLLFQQTENAPSEVPVEPNPALGPNHLTTAFHQE